MLFTIPRSILSLAPQVLFARRVLGLENESDSSIAHLRVLLLVESWLGYPLDSSIIEYHVLAAEGFEVEDGRLLYTSPLLRMRKANFINSNP